MNINEYNVEELSTSDTKSTNGGFVFLFALASALAIEAILLAPLAGSFMKGWNSYTPE